MASTSKGNSPKRVMKPPAKPGRPSKASEAARPMPGNSRYEGVGKDPRAR